jgi:hypothetical protein
VACGLLCLIDVIPTNDTLPIWLKPFRRRRRVVLPSPTGPLQQVAAPTAPDPVAPEHGTDEPKENRYLDLLPSRDEIASRCPPPVTRRIPRAARPTRLPAPAEPARRILPKRQERPDPTVEPAHPPTQLNMEAVLLPALAGGEIEEFEEFEEFEDVPAELRSPLRRTVLLAVAAGAVISLALGLIVVLVMVVSGPAPVAADPQPAPAVAAPETPPAKPAVNTTRHMVFAPEPIDAVAEEQAEPEVVAPAPRRRRRPALRRRSHHRPRRQVDADALLMAGGGTQAREAPAPARVDADALLAAGTTKPRPARRARSTQGVVIPGLRVPSWMR